MTENLLNELKLHFITTDNELIFSERIDSYITILIFKLDIKFGKAERYLEQIKENIKKK